MVRPFGKIVFALCALLCFAWAGLVSAQRIAPTVGPDLAAYLAAGGSLDDLCGGDIDHTGPHCPFCNALDRLFPPAPIGQHWQLIPTDAPVRLATLVTPAPLPASLNARGPPHFG